MGLDAAHDPAAAVEIHEAAERPVGRSGGGAVTGPVDPHSDVVAVRAADGEVFRAGNVDELSGGRHLLEPLASAFVANLFERRAAQGVELVDDGRCFGFESHGAQHMCAVRGGAAVSRRWSAGALCSAAVR